MIEAIAMSTARFSLRLDPELKEWLEREAERQDRSVAWLAKQAIETMKDSVEARRKMIHDAVVQANEGAFVSQKAVHDWMATWDTDGEAPAPGPDVFLKHN